VFSSTISPWSMTAMRSEISSSSGRSCVMKTTANPNCSRSRMISRRMPRWTTTSSAVVGSSMIITCGRRASAMAIMTRCRMPPESSWAKLSSRFGSTPTIRRSSRASASICFLGMPGRCVVKTSRSWRLTLMTGLSEFIAPWKTMEILSQRNTRRLSPDSPRTSMSVPDSSWNVTAPLARSAGGLSSRFRP